MADNGIEALLAYANEHYAHARDHEHLRSQVTAILSAGSTVLLGITLEHVGEKPLISGISGLVVLLLGALNLRLNFLHTNRFKAHVSAAYEALMGVEGSGSQGATTVKSCRDIFHRKKIGDLSFTWNILPSILMALGGGICFYNSVLIFCPPR